MTSHVLSTIADIAATVAPVTERTVRDVIADLGYSRPPGRKKYLFNAGQVARIREAVTCRLIIHREPERAIEPISSGVASTVALTSKSRGRRIRAALRNSGTPSGATSAKVLSLETERQRRSTMQSGFTKPRGI